MYEFEKSRVICMMDRLKVFMQNVSFPVPGIEIAGRRLDSSSGEGGDNQSTLACPPVKGGEAQAGDSGRRFLLLAVCPIGIART